MNLKNVQTAILGGGCFWCIEAAFSRVTGVISAKSGYSGGKTHSPDYKSVCTGQTGHAEVVEVSFNPEQITYEELLLIFFAIHDPTQLNRQGNDIGTQYRSVIFPVNDEQKIAATELIEKLNDSDEFSDELVTTIEPLATFYPAEDYHDDYYDQNANQPYCQLVIKPKLDKLIDRFSNRLK